MSCVPDRLTGFSRKSENSLALMEQMKTSHISNKLLRREVSALKRSKTKWEEHLQKEQLEMKQKMSMMHREKAVILETEQTAKVSCNLVCCPLTTHPYSSFGVPFGGCNIIFLCKIKTGKELLYSCFCLYRLLLRGRLMNC